MDDVTHVHKKLFVFDRAIFDTKTTSGQRRANVGTFDSMAPDKVLPCSEDVLSVVLVDVHWMTAQSPVKRCQALSQLVNLPVTEVLAVD